MTLPPVQRSIVVGWTPAAAFRRFTAEINRWWPSTTHSVGGKMVRSIVFEERNGGRIYEEHRDGRRFQWGTVLVWSPPGLVRFTWHPGRPAEEAQEVEVRFLPEGSGTKLELAHFDWEKMGAKAVRARKAYNLGWRYVLDVWADRTGPLVWSLDVVAKVMSLVVALKNRGTDPRDEAQGEIKDAA